MTTHTENFDAQRALLNDELTAIALAGGNTSKTREKLAALDKREQAAQEAEQASAQAAADEQRRQFEMEAVRAASELATAALLRLTDAGFEVGENDAKNLALAAHDVVRFDADIAEVKTARHAAYQAAMNIATRIDLLNARANALQQLRLTDQAVPRDAAESETIRADLMVLNAAYGHADAAAQAVTVPAHMIENRPRALQKMQALEIEIRKRIVWERARAAELAYMDAIRAVCAESGSRGPAGLYMRSTEFDRFLRTNQL
ncbi:hypothetical protein [Paraburkholderia solisilvae]|uniref:Uncharacterized protein n=1 Tax=Paraburkholderia solisilvae TaxID=624376 RepID=A0A6J5DJ01_9BURK|nr:hypothetical protein [Paraburkholderia solisilvae]CAB3753015.1 hypothetical protein LMG29739_01643 [Paraburkholderia solisilvae]